MSNILRKIERTQKWLITGSRKFTKAYKDARYNGKLKEYFAQYRSV